MSIYCSYFPMSNVLRIYLLEIAHLSVYFILQSHYQFKVITVYLIIKTLRILVGIVHFNVYLEVVAVQWIDDACV